MKCRESWLDYLRAFACILVTLGHLLLSFQDARIIRQESFVSVIIDFIYLFHVYIFFFCSGYLFNSKKRESLKEISAYKIDKVINFVFLYVVFTCITYAIKLLFASDVNTAVEYNLLQTLLQYPINQMWYLYAISIIYLFAYPIQSKKAEIGVICVALLLKIITIIPGLNPLIPVPINYLFQNMIWFVMGQEFARRKIKLNKMLSLSFAVLFVLIFVLRSIFDLEYGVFDATLTFLGIAASAGIIYSLTKNKTTITGPMKYIAKYMLQIYLLHTIFAAGIRIILFKVGVAHFIPHFILGMAFSFVAPIICAVIAEKIKFLNIIFFPTKTIKSLVKKKEQNSASHIDQ